MTMDQHHTKFKLLAKYQIYGLMQDCGIPIANTLETPQSRRKSSKYYSPEVQKRISQMQFITSIMHTIDVDPNDFVI